MRKRSKITISVSYEALREAERLGRARDQSRSAVFERAVLALGEELRRVELARAYVEGYRRVPEALPEVDEALVLALHGLTAERWT